MLTKRHFFLSKQIPAPPNPSPLPASQIRNDGSLTYKRQIYVLVHVVNNLNVIMLENLNKVQTFKRRKERF